MLEIININDHQPTDLTILPIQLFDGIFRPCPFIQQTGSGIPGCRSQIVSFLLPVPVRGYDTSHHITFFRDPGAFDPPYPLVLLLTDEFHLKEIISIAQMCTEGPKLPFQYGNITALMCLLHILDQDIYETIKLGHSPPVDILIYSNLVLSEQVFKKINIFQCHKMTVFQDSLLQA